MIGLPSASSSGVSSFFSSVSPSATGATTGSSSVSSSSVLPNVVSRSITSRSRMSSFSNSSRQMVIALNVSGLSHSPGIMVLRPASIRLAMAISPSRLSSSTDPISRRYMRTGSSVRSSFSPPVTVTATSRLAAIVAISVEVLSSSSASSSSMILMPISDSIDITSSICSLETCSGGKTLFNWS